MQTGRQRAISAPASSSSSSSSATRSAAALSNSQPSDVKALTSQVDEFASAVKLLADKASSGGKGRDRSRPPRNSKRQAFRKNGGEGNKSKGSGAQGKGSRFEDLLRQQRQVRPQARWTGNLFQVTRRKMHRPRLRASSRVRRLRSQHFVETVQVLEICLKPNFDPGLA